jgi:hypothetical protein
MMSSNIFTQHPIEVRMSYLEHTRFALMLSGKTLTCGIASLIHAFFPFLFVTHTSTTIKELQDIFEKREKEITAIKFETNPNLKYGSKALGINPEKIRQMDLPVYHGKKTRNLNTQYGNISKGKEYH